MNAFPFPPGAASVSYNICRLRNRPSVGRHRKIPPRAISRPRLAAMMDPKATPFDGRRMFRGGFKQIVAL
jgi:uncharacterized protein YbaA (DUF1428 family)